MITQLLLSPTLVFSSSSNIHTSFVLHPHLSPLTRHKMAPTALQTTSELIHSGVKRNLVQKPVSNSYSTRIDALDASKLIITPNRNPHAVPETDSPEVWAQNACSDHMIICKWTSTTGWAAPHLQPYGPIQLMPTASVLHYATECTSFQNHLASCGQCFGSIDFSGPKRSCLLPFHFLGLSYDCRLTEMMATLTMETCTGFEGLRFYRGYDLKLRLFRPDRNTRRMLNSATRK